MSRYREMLRARRVMWISPFAIREWRMAHLMRALPAWGRYRKHVWQLARQKAKTPPQ
jgi:hypothetical protein